MKLYFPRQMLKGGLSVCLIVLISFALPRLIPGSPLFAAQTDLHALNSLLPEETFRAFSDYYAPDKSMGEQLMLYLGHLLRFDLGYSFYFRLPVTEVITARIAWTVFLALVSLIIAALIGVLSGVNLALAKNARRGKLALRFFSLCQSLPVFVTAIILQIIFCYRLGWLPSSGAYTPGAAVDGPAFIFDIAVHALLPLAILVVAEVPGIFLLTYSVSTRIRRAQYVEMAYYLNLSDKVVRHNYVLRNALPEVLSKLNIQFLYAVSGILFVEAVFSYPGMGTLLRIAASSRDYPLLQGILLCSGLYGLVVNWLFVLATKKISPQVRHD